jgi:hypothetical protein
MKAIRCRAWGAPDTLRLEEAESAEGAATSSAHSGACGGRQFC